ncbi:TetR family transcriptional regulator [Sinomonas cyclohexanicum]|uniref:TetR family transcriptional regulator n=1 Tax=Sinomonas cyclohexanicum TaxID=322009 RepID=A0ABM7PU60_SINCY|nr:TetR family transcriptional regulator [Corynebacterium cyclohexanicum]BCT75719.1 TetR family transcriptional regulator [Corynebacterium cyclohexanicum]
MSSVGRTAKRGRPDDGGDRRARILAAAGRLFADHGFDAVSLRRVAREAKVDPALVHHYFGGKDELFGAAVSLPADPGDLLAGLDPAVPEGRGRIVAHAVLALWEGPQQHVLAAFLRATIGSTSRTRLLRDVVRRRILARVAEGLPYDDAERDLRAALAATQVVGFILVRYVVRLEPVASLPAEDAEALLAPAVERHLTGALPAVPGAAGPGA